MQVAEDTVLRRQIKCIGRKVSSSSSWPEIKYASPPPLRGPSRAISAKSPHEKKRNLENAFVGFSICLTTFCGGGAKKGEASQSAWKLAPPRWGRRRSRKRSTRIDSKKLFSFDLQIRVYSISGRV